MIAIFGLISAARADVPSRGAPFTISGLGLEMLPMPAGTFLMGSPADEQGRALDEDPRTQVTISRSFWLGKTDVTHGQWKKIMRSDLSDQGRKAMRDDTIYGFADKLQTMRDHLRMSRYDDPMGIFGNSQNELPMYFVSWDEAMAFCRKMTEQARKNGSLPAGYEYTLPTEAQWEYACRAGTTAMTYAGPLQILGADNAPVLDPIAWYGGNSSIGYRGNGFDTSKWPDKQYPGGKAGPRNVGLKEPNAWGLHDMIGDVCQWCSDWYGPYHGGKVTDPVGPKTGDCRVFRGCGWNGPAYRCRAAYRSNVAPSGRHYALGFRLALSPVQGGS